MLEAKKSVFERIEYLIYQYDIRYTTYTPVFSSSGRVPFEEVCLYGIPVVRVARNAHEYWIKYNEITYISGTPELSRHRSASSDVYIDFGTNIVQDPHACTARNTFLGLQVA